MAVSRVQGKVISSSRLVNSKRSSVLAVRPGVWFCRQSSNNSPTPQLNSHWKNVCWSVPGVDWLHNLQRGEGAVFILCSLSWVQSKFSSNFQRKEARSGGIPVCLQSDQESCQSVVGFSSSALQGLYWLSPVTWLISMVLLSSVSSLVQSLSVMVMMLRGVWVMTVRMSVNRSWVKYGGDWAGTPGIFLLLEHIAYTGLSAGGWSGRQGWLQFGGNW